MPTSWDHAPWSADGRCELSRERSAISRSTPSTAMRRFSRSIRVLRNLLECGAISILDPLLFQAVACELLVRAREIGRLQREILGLGEKEIPHRWRILTVVIAGCPDRPLQVAHGVPALAEDGMVGSALPAHRATGVDPQRSHRRTRRLEEHRDSGSIAD